MKCIITTFNRHNSSYRIAALYDNDRKMVEFIPEQAGHESILGNIYIGRVDNIAENINAAFVKIDEDTNCYLPLKDFKNPIFTNKSSKHKPIAQGDELVVQVTREAQKTKSPAVSTRLKTDSQKSLDEIFLNAAHRTCYSLLYKPKPYYLKYLDSFKPGIIDEAVTDDIKIFYELCDKYNISEEMRTTPGSVSVPVYSIETDYGLKIKYHDDTGISLAALYSITTNIEEALSKRLWLKSGANLIIERTEAMTVIDVNTAKNISGKDAPKNFYATNMEAASAIARQLRLRNISGIIICDFINMPDEAMQDELTAYFKECLSKDPITAKVIDMTGLGLVEVTRKKVRKSVAEIINH